MPPYVVCPIILVPSLKIFDVEGSSGNLKMSIRQIAIAAAASQVVFFLNVVVVWYLLHGI